MATNIKSYREYYRRLLFMEEERKKYFVEMSKVVSLGEGEKVKILLDILKKEGRTRTLSLHRENDGESMLHVAAKFNQSSEVIQLLIKACPELMLTARKESDEYYGQTALHILIAKGNTEAVETMLAEILNHSQSVKAALLHQMATGAKFANTVMMGELPLSVAALTFNFEMIEALLQNGAEMDRKNTKGDTVFHTLIRFAAIYPELTPCVLETLEFLHDKIKENMVSPADQDVLSMECDHSDYSYRWFIPNADDLNPLQLAAQLSQARIFQFILNLPKVYSFLNSHDGLFDKKLYDITEIDTVATERWAFYQRSRRSRMRRHVAPVIADGVARQKFSNPSTTSVSLKDFLWREQTKSILEMMFDIRGTAAYEFIQQPALRHIIKIKWLYYRTFYYSWMLFHLLFMIALTVFAVLNADSYGQDASVMNGAQTIEDHRKVGFLDAFSYCYLIIGVLYFFQEVIHALFRVKKFSLAQLLNVLHNGSYRVVLVTFSLSLIFDFIFSKSMADYENLILIIALVTGWWFMVFFIRAHRKFSFFTVMIQKILFGDMLRFAVVIVLFKVAFTAGIYMAFQGSSAAADKGFDSFGTTMLLLFKLMLGLGDIEDLYEARRAWLAITLFIIFVLLTYVLMFNALIAMMSQTCMMVSENRLVQWRVQQLSVIMFFEGLFPTCMAKLVGIEKHVKRFDPEIKQVIDEKRYYLDVSSIHTEYANAEDIYAMKYKLQTLPFGDQRTFSPNFNVTIPTHHFLMSPRHQVQFTSTRHANYGFSSPTSRSDNNQNQPNPAVHVTTVQNSNAENDSPMVIKRRKSKREKSPSGASRPDYPNDSPENPKQNKKKMKRKRIEPEGDINTSYDDQSPRRNFYLNHSHLTVPDFGIQNVVPERRRYNSENGLMDTHIGQQPPLQIPVQPLRLPVEQISRVQPHDGSALDIGVIADSYM